MDFQHLSLAWKICVGVAATGFLIGLLYFGQISAPSLVAIVILFACSSIAYSALFFVVVRIIAPELSQFIIDDQTEISGPRITMVTTTIETGAADIDKWVKRYVFARNTFGLSVIPLGLLAWVFLFA